MFKYRREQDFWKYELWPLGARNHLAICTDQQPFKPLQIPWLILKVSHPGLDSTTLHTSPWLITLTVLTIIQSTTNRQWNNQAVSFYMFLKEQRKWLQLFIVSVEQSTFALTVPALCRPAAVKQLYAHLLLLLDFIYDIWSGEMLFSSKYEMLEECLTRFDVNIWHLILLWSLILNLQGIL